MKFSELDAATWEDNKQYFDTCLLPITGLSGRESPIAVTEELEKLRDIMDLIEIPFHGRVITYPAYHFFDGGAHDQQGIRSCCNELKKQGFRYIILITAKPNVRFQIEEADLWIMPSEDGNLPIQMEINGYVRELWHS